MVATNTYNLDKLRELERRESLPDFTLPPILARLSESDVPNYASLNDEQEADHLLSLRKGSKKPLIRTKRRLESHTYKNVTEILPGLVQNDGRPGLVQALMRKASNKVENAERRQIQIEQRDALLGSAVRRGNVELVGLLAPTCSQNQRNQALGSAIRRRNEAIITKLLEYGADPNKCKDQFTEACQKGDVAVVSILLRAPIPTHTEILVDALTQAVKSGSLQILTLLTGAVDLANTPDLEAVHEAVRVVRVDLLLRLLLCAKSLNAQKLDGLVKRAFEMSNADAGLRLRIIDALFYAGASGNNSAASFADAVASDLTDFIALFAKHHVSINWEEGKAVVRAARAGRSELLKAVLASGGLAPDNASRAMKALPRHVPAEERKRINEMLLDTGAHGSAIDHELILAVKDSDERAIGMLLRRGASLTRNKGHALIEAIEHEQVGVLRTLLTWSVNTESLQKAFPHLRSAGKAPRLEMTRLLLDAKASGDSVNAALRDAVCDQSADRDPLLIDALIKAGADPSFNDAESIRHAINMNDVKLFMDLTKSATLVSEGVFSSLTAEIVTLENLDARYYMMRRAIEQGARVKSISRALCSELSKDKAEVRMIDLLVNRGSAEVDDDGGRALKLAAVQQDDDILQLVASSHNLSSQTVSKGLCDMLQSENFNDEQKSFRAEILLSKKKSDYISVKAFSTYVKFCTTAFVSGRVWPLRTFEALLQAGADINMASGAVFTSVVDNAAIPLAKAMLACGVLRQEIVDQALLHCVRLPTVDDRSEAIGLLIQYRPSFHGLSDALIEASQLQLTGAARQLLQHGVSINFQDHEAAIQVATSTGNSMLLATFLSFKLSHSSLSAAFQEAITLKDSALRFSSMKAILQAGLRGDIVDQHLIALVRNDLTPIDEIELLLDHEASVHAQNSFSIIFAATSRNRDVLRLLFTRAVLPNTAARCFQACLAAGLVERHEIRVLKFLLEQGEQMGQGVDQALLDQALLKSVENLGTDPSGGLPMVQMLVEKGARADLGNGAVLCRACEIGRVDIVSTLLLSNPGTSSKSRALHYLVKSSVPGMEFCTALDMIMASTSPGNPGGTRSLYETTKPNFVDHQRDFESPIRVLLKGRPGDTHSLMKVIGYGYNVATKFEKDILYWAMSQQNPRIKTDCLQILIQNGANVHSRDPATGDTMILMALRTGRSALVDNLIQNGADVSATNDKGNSPLLLASELGNTAAAERFIATGVNLNDGSLHQAARNLQLSVVKSLLQNGADPNYRSRVHGGRSPLGELCLTAQASGSSYQVMVDTLRELCQGGADFKERIGRKPLICLALDNSDPAPMVEAIMAAYLSKLIDEDFNLYEENDVVYSPTYYVLKGIFRGPAAKSRELVRLLRTYGANRDVYYSLSGPQPPKPQGMPPHIAEKEAIRIAKEEEIAAEEADYRRKVNRLIEEEQRQQSIEQQRHELKLKHHEELGMQSIGQARQLSRVDRERREDEYNHQRLLNDLSRQREQDQLRTRQSERDQDERHRRNLLKIETAAYGERMQIDLDNRKQIDYIERKAIDYKVTAEEGLAEREHRRRIEQLTLAKAVPIGLPMLNPSPSGGGFIEGPK
ncbi:uncharacterized protein Z518_02810 [Rhinocladiella mackenziei CBS 650.93]|uniref:Uncharacterized protein n=1 Tax=Rhinocladiella mackenziei CBS 650.93 TaxID=1442369 RepID=A0A0D2IQF1_9EURO|nr:uncharacterized protein Z518_02810 [Rhinocladiella mackenziei CBS 650.93]KIX08154.1 hypothetical protein Z518_02810 [Rhinocladiella mackenziei CBS 650.93]